MNSNDKKVFDLIWQNIDQYIEKRYKGKKKYYLERDGKIMYNSSGNFLYASRGAAINAIAGAVSWEKMHKVRGYTYSIAWQMRKAVKKKFYEELKSGRIICKTINNE